MLHAPPATRAFLLAAVVLSLCVVPPGAMAQGARRPTRILLLYQQQAETRRMQEFTFRLRQTVQDLAWPVEFYQESMDVERFGGREHSSSLAGYFVGKYRGFGIDVIVPVGARAYRFVVDELDEALSRVPIVCALCTAPPLNPAALPANVTGRFAQPSRYAHTLSLARGLQPDAERIVVVGGGGAIDSISVSAAVSAVASLGDTLQLTVLRGLPLDTLLRDLHRLPRRSIVLFANYREDAHGRKFEPIDIIGTLARAASAPMYVQLREFIGEGVVGGSVIEMDTEGAHTGRLVARVLRRRPGDPMPVVEPLSRTAVADWRQLRRWGLSAQLLPPGSVLVFRERTLWQRYRAVVLLTAVVISVESLLIGLLLIERRRRKRAQVVLEEEQRRAEEARLQVAHMGRVALVGELAATISHDLRQPLAAIRVNAEVGATLLAESSSDPSEAREIFQSIVADNARAVAVIESIRKLLRKDDALVTTLDLNEVCRESARLLQHDAVRRETRLELSLVASAAMVTGDPVQLQQAMLNLMLNGLDAASLSTTDRFVVVQTEATADHVEVLVRDSGSGLSPTLQARLFESFFSTKKAGLGLGLVIVRSIVERHGGQVRAENHASGGAVFRIRLARASGYQQVDASAHALLGEARDAEPQVRALRRRAFTVDA